MKKVLIIGAGGREHALAWKMAQSTHTVKVFCAPGNPGTAMVSQNIDIAVDDIEGLVAFALREEIDLTVVGPEYPLTCGVVDAFREAGLSIFGPEAEAAAIEGSKVFAKSVMVEAGVPTARYEKVSSEEQVKGRLKSYNYPIVLKADGLAAGKGVCICNSEDEVDEACNHLFSVVKAEGVIIEEFLVGREASFIVATDGERIVPFAPAHDYKRIFDNDKGANTGGMGSVSPTPHLENITSGQIIKEVIEPVLKQMKERGTPYSGFLYAGLMIGTNGSLNVLEFNARSGDPETQVILPRLESDLYLLLKALADRTQLPEISWTDQTAVGLVLAADGYPGSVRTGDVIEGIEFAMQLPDTLVFQAGTTISDGKPVTAGGRVMTVVGSGPDLESARLKAYRAADMIQFRGRQIRRDIGKQG